MIASTETLQRRPAVPSLHPSESSLMALIREGYLKNPSKQMIICNSHSLTYAEAYFRACSFARYVRVGAGLTRESTVIVSLSNSVELPLMIAAFQFFGIRVGLVTANAEKKEFANAIALLHPQLAVVGSADHCRFIREIDPAMQLMTVGCNEEGAMRVEEAMKVSGSMMDSPLSCGLNDDAPIILFSSGSTGKPKAIANHSSSFLANAVKLTAALGVTGDDVLYAPVPASHVYGLIGTYAALVRGATLVTISKYRPEASLALIRDARATIYFGVTTMYLREMRINESGDWDLSSLRLGMIAGASCPEEPIEQFEHRFGCTLVQSYGMTETAATLTVGDVTDPLSIRATSVGKAIPDVQLKVDEKTGEILTKTPSLMIGVITQEGVDISLVDDEGWLHTGDVGRFDGQGNLCITGRIKDMIIRGGINIFPAEIENVYQDHPSIIECCLVGYPDFELGERTCLCVIVRDPEEESSLDLRTYAKGRIEKCKLPDTVLKMEELPHLANGKIDKSSLRARVENILGPTGSSDMAGKPRA